MRTRMVGIRLLALTGAMLLGAWGAQQAGLLNPRTAAQFGAPYAGVADTARHAAAIEQARQTALEMVARGISGLAVAVAVDGQIVWSEGFGFADLEQKVPVWPSTRFRIGSVSKPLTAAAVGVLVEQGKLDLDAPVQRYVPGFPDKGAPITTRQIAGHLAGIRHYRGDEFLLQKRFRTVEEGLAIFKDDPLLHPPGSRYLYSSYGWNLVSAAVEGAAKQDFLVFMQENVFQPLGMRGTAADQNELIVEQRTRFYTRADDKLLYNAPYVDNSYKWAGGGFLSTVEDLVRFGSAHLRAGFLKPDTVKVLWTSQRTSAGEETGYGIGWGLNRDAKGRRTVQHGGGSVGGTSMLIIYPDAKVVVAVLSNLTQAPYNARDVQKIADPFIE